MGGENCTVAINSILFAGCPHKANGDTVHSGTIVLGEMCTNALDLQRYRHDREEDTLSPVG